jgi:hypothetical protein
MSDARDANTPTGEPSGGGVVRDSDAHLRDVVRQIEAMRREHGSNAASASTLHAGDVTCVCGAQAGRPGKSPEEAAREIARLGASRARFARELSIAAIITATRNQAADVHRKLGELIELWEELVPQEVAAHTALTALKGGVLHVTVDSSSIAYELDRLLREGLVIALRTRYRGTLTRVKVSLAVPAQLQS